MRTSLLSATLAVLLGLGILQVPAQVTDLPDSGVSAIALPDFGDPSRQHLSTADEYRLGQEVMRKIRSQGVILEDIQLNEYLTSVGQRIAAYAGNGGQPFTFFWVEDPAINAFATPGGFIGVHAGLMLATEHEDELAGVLAHEIAHVAQRHVARSFADARRLTIPFAAAMVASALLAATAPGDIGQAALVGTLAASTQHQINFTRASEQEADRVGTRLLLQSGYDPDGLARLFARLEGPAGISGSEVPEFLRTHPLPRNRLADIRNRIGGERSASKDRLAYHLAKARLQVLTHPYTRELIREFETLLAQGSLSPREAAGLRYGHALALKRAGRYQDAQRRIERLLKSHPDHLALRIEEAELALAKGERARAWRLFEQTAGLYPDDLTLTVHYGQALASQGDPHKAMALLQPHLRRRAGNASLYALYAQAAQRAGDATMAHATLAEYYYLNGDLTRAIEQAELGLDRPGATPYQQAQLRARLRRLREEKLATR